MSASRRKGQVVAVGTLLAVLVLISVTAFLYELYTSQQEMRLLDEERSREKLEILEAGFWRLDEHTPTSTEPAGMEHALSRLCLLYTSPSPRDGLLSRMPSSA